MQLGELGQCRVAFEQIRGRGEPDGGGQAPEGGGGGGGMAPGAGAVPGAGAGAVPGIGAGAGCWLARRANSRSRRMARTAAR